MSIFPIIIDRLVEIDNLPQRVINLGMEGYFDLTRILEHNLIGENKYILSDNAGYDVGTPETVKAILATGHFNTRTLELYRLLIEGYLLETDFYGKIENPPDEHGRSVLEGELKRYEARKNSIIDPRTVQVTRRVIDDYCQEYELDLAESFSEKLEALE